MLESSWLVNEDNDEPRLGADPARETITLCCYHPDDAAEDDRAEVRDGEGAITFPAVAEVCGTCRGKGKHVNRAIDGHGISPEEFAEDPDFAEAYFGGAYDVSCEECDGDRVVWTVDTSKLTDAQRVHFAAYQEREREESEYRAMCAAERAFGC